jgi:hypothetical protein
MDAAAYKSSFDVEAELRETSGPVTVADVIKFALPAHKKCGGKGWSGKKEKPRLCPCAVKRFLRANASKVVQVEEGEWAWLRGPIDDSPIKLLKNDGTPLEQKDLP